MNREEFEKYILSTRDCNDALLDVAVQKGLRRARDRAPDPRKLFMLTAACAITAALCLAVNTGIFKAAADGYFRDRGKATQSAVEALGGYAAELADSIIKYLGDG